MLLSTLGRKRDNPLTRFLFALILQKIFSIPTDSLLILFLILCRELRDFCGFSKVPDAPLFTHFKLGFEDYIELIFQNMVDFTEPICQKLVAKHLYINGHFSYADKFDILTNGLSIIRHIVFLYDDFKLNHLGMSVDKKSNSPAKDKSIGDSTALKPVLSDFFALHAFHPSTFMGDSAFDIIDTYSFLKYECHFSKALIPYNSRNASFLNKV